MDLIYWIIILVIVIIGVGLTFKIAKFFFKMVSLVLLLIVFVWFGFFLYDLDSDPQNLYIVLQNDTYSGYTLLGKQFEFSTLDDEYFNQSIENISNVFLIDYETLSKECGKSADINTTNESLEIFSDDIATADNVTLAQNQRSVIGCILQIRDFSVWQRIK